MNGDDLRPSPRPVALCTLSVWSFPYDLPRSPYQWARHGTAHNTLRELADPLWQDYGIRHPDVPRRGYTLTLLDGTRLPLDTPIALFERPEAFEHRYDGSERLWVRFVAVRFVAKHDDGGEAQP